VRQPSRLAEHRLGLVRAGRPAAPREPERQGIQERLRGRVRLAAVAPVDED
jgi:hypothetical protein